MYLYPSYLAILFMLLPTIYLLFLSICLCRSVCVSLWRSFILFEISIASLNMCLMRQKRFLVVILSYGIRIFSLFFFCCFFVFAFLQPPMRRRRKRDGYPPLLDISDAPDYTDEQKALAIEARPAVRFYIPTHTHSQILVRVSASWFRLLLILSFLPWPRVCVSLSLSRSPVLIYFRIPNEITPENCFMWSSVAIYSML